MICHAWTVICEKSIIDRETNNISVDVLEQLDFYTSPLPGEAKEIILPKQMEIVSLWYREQGDEGVSGRGQLKIEMSDGKALSATNLEIDLTKSYRQRTRVRLNGLPIPKSFSGFFYFVVLLESNGKWTEVARIPLEVNVKQTAS